MLDWMEKSANSFIEKVGCACMHKDIIKASIRWIERVNAKKCGC